MAAVTDHSSSQNAELANQRIFYGWCVVAAAFTVTLIGFGLAYTFSAFVASLQRDFGASRGSVPLSFQLRELAMPANVGF
ncbi:MAG TPA: hypothetical protein VGJ20_25210 [Xanthobacteraceae bacterium]|jgi:hypothetical protein